MKRLFPLIAVPFVLGSCNFEYSEGQSDSEIETESHGITCDKAFITNEDGDEISSLYLGEEVIMNFDNVKGFEVKDGKISVDYMFLFTTTDGDTLFFSDYGEIDTDEYEFEESDNINFYTFSPIDYPLHGGESYIFRSGVEEHGTDKRIEGEAELKILANPHVTNKFDGLECADVALHDYEEEAYIVGNDVSAGMKFQVYLIEPTGFILNEDETVNLGLAVALKDANGKVLYENPDMASAQEEGMPYADIQSALTVNFTMPECNTEDANLVIEVWDKNGNGNMRSDIELKFN